MAKKKEEVVEVGKLSDIKDVEYISTGVAELDELVGGFARGRLTQLWGKPGVGKSYLLAKCMASLDGKVLYVDTEFALNKERLQDLGVDLKKVDYLANSQLEDVTEMILGALGKYDLIILDTLAKLVPMTVETNKVGENALGLFARQIKHFEAKMRPKLYNSKTVFIAINQARAGFGMMSPAKPQGGFAWEHSIDIQIKLSKKANNKIMKQIAGEKTQVGHVVTCEVEKSRLTPPNISTSFTLMY